MRERYIEQQSGAGQTITVSGLDGARGLLFSPKLSDPQDIRNSAAILQDVKIPALLRAVGVEYGRDPKQQLAIGKETAEAISNVGGLLLDLAAMKPDIVLPASGGEIQNFVVNAIQASVSGDPLQLYIPCCPDWSQDNNGRYDYRSLNGGPSFIAEKFFQESPSVLAALNKHNVPYRGTVVIADWGLENDIEAYDRNGERLTRNAVSERFISTARHAENSLSGLKQGSDMRSLYVDFRVTRMSDLFLELGVNPDETYAEAYKLLLAQNKGQKLVRELHAASLPINMERRGLSEDENYQQAVQSLAEYATLSSSLPDRSILFAAESQTTSKGYNVLRQIKMPVVFLKGKTREERAVNIL